MRQQNSTLQLVNIHECTLGRHPHMLNVACTDWNKMHNQADWRISWCVFLCGGSRVWGSHLTVTDQRAHGAVRCDCAGWLQPEVLTEMVGMFSVCVFLLKVLLLLKSVDFPAPCDYITCRLPVVSSGLIKNRFHEQPVRSLYRRGSHAIGTPFYMCVKLATSVCLNLT